MVVNFYKGKDRLKFDIPDVQEVGQYENSLICTGKAEGVTISVKVDYAVPPQKLSQTLVPFRRMGLSGYYQIIETNKTSLYTEYISIGEGKRKILFQLYLYQNSLPDSPARPVKELLEIPEVAAFLLSIKSDN